MRHKFVGILNVYEARERENARRARERKKEEKRTKEKRPVRKEIDEKRFSDVRKTASAFGFRAFP